MVELGLILVALYFLDGVAIGPVDSVVFSARPWSGFSVRRPRAVRPDARRGVIVPEPWIPALTRLVAHRPAREQDGRFDVDRARRRLLELREATAAARIPVWLLTLNLLVAGPIAGHVWGTARVWLPWLVAHVVLAALSISLVLVNAAGRPAIVAFARGQRFETLLTLALYPPAAARIIQVASRDVCAGLDPLAIAAALDTPGLVERLASERYVELAMELDRSDPGRSTIVRDEVESVDRLVRSSGIDPCALLARPTPHLDSVAYCPRCALQYRDGVASCSDCGGVALIPFVEPAPAAPVSPRRPRRGRRR